MEIANIITDKIMNIGPEFNVVNDVNDIIFKNLPTLIVGYDEICKQYGEGNINVLNRNVGKNVFWTYKRTSKRQIYDIDLEAFIRHSYKNYTSKINYVDLDLIQFSNKKLIKIVRKLLTLKNFITYESEQSVIFIYSENIIFGIDLNIVDFVGLDSNKIREKIKLKSLVFLKGDSILNEYKHYLDRLNNDIKLIPFLYSINPTIE